MVTFNRNAALECFRREAWRQLKYMTRKRKNENEKELGGNDTRLEKADLQKGKDGKMMREDVGMKKKGI